MQLKRENNHIIDMWRRISQSANPFNSVNDAHENKRTSPTVVYTRGANDASRVRVQLSSSRVVNILSRAGARVELIRAELDSTH